MCVTFVYENCKCELPFPLSTDDLLGEFFHMLQNRINIWSYILSIHKNRSVLSITQCNMKYSSVFSEVYLLTLKMSYYVCSFIVFDIQGHIFIYSFENGVSLQYNFITTYYKTKSFTTTVCRFAINIKTSEWIYMWLSPIDTVIH